MINDCSHVGETLIKYFPSDVRATHLKRTKGFFDKTVGMAYKIMKEKADVYHINYLLQECYIALKLRKHPVIGHAHGSDLRDTLNQRILGKLVKYNLKHCDKVFVSTPDILDTALIWCESAEYIPTPVDTELFHPNPMRIGEDKIKVLIASGCNWRVKGTDMAIRALAELKGEVEAYMINYGRDVRKTIALANSLNLRLNLLPKTFHANMKRYYWNAHVVIDQFKSGVSGQIALEAIASGRPVITYFSSMYDIYKDFPLKDVSTVEKVVDSIRRMQPMLWQKEYDYLQKNHDPRNISHYLREVYRDQLGWKNIATV